MKYSKDIVLSHLIDNPSITIGELPLTISEYAQLLFPGKLYGNQYIYDKKAHNELLDKLSFHYPSNGANFIHKAGMAFALCYATKKELFTEPEKYYRAIEKSYHRVCELQLDLLNKIIGVGFTGMVFDFDRDTIVKISFNKLKEKEVEFWNYQKSHSNPIFPHINYVDEDIVIMERLLTQSENLDTYRLYIGKYVKINYIEEISYRTLNTEVGQLPDDFCNFITNIQDAFYDAFNIRSIGDLKIENLGERHSTGQIVMFDPIGGYLDNYERIITYNKENMRFRK